MEKEGSVSRDTTTVIEALSRHPAMVIELLREVPPEVLKRRPQPGKWSAHEHACHLAVVHPVFFERLELMLGKEKRKIQSYMPDRDQEEGALLKLDLEGSLARFQADRARLVERVKELTPEQWNLTAEHEEYDHYSMYIMFRHLALHDMLHAYRIEEILLKKDWDV
jgi:hypothetical protein